MFFNQLNDFEQQKKDATNYVFSS